MSIRRGLLIGALAMACAASARGQPVPVPPEGPGPVPVPPEGPGLVPVPPEGPGLVPVPPEGPGQRERWKRRWRRAWIAREGPFFPRQPPAMGLLPWNPRVRENLNPRGHGLIDLRKWPAEPVAPDNVDQARLAGALKRLATRQLPDRYVRRLAGWIASSAAEFGVDPFLLGAVAQDQSQLQSRKHTSYGVGVLAIQPSMHAGRIRAGEYRYAVWKDGKWSRRALPVGRHPFTVASLKDPEVSIYFGAAILRVWSEQCPGVDRYFRSVPHRHMVSHFVWGDGVLGAGLEDRILRERRRLIGYYLGVPPFPRGRFRSQLLYCPLDGPPRKVTSVLGDDRDEGLRLHTGIDFNSAHGEPVRAVAEGEVILAGVDWGRNQLRSLSPGVALVLPPVSIGPRGLLVMIQHRAGLASTYMHLAAYTVRIGDRVRGGQLIGYVGRTGIKASPAHLHFDMRLRGRFIDPMDYLGPYVIHPDRTYIGRRKAAVQTQQRLLRFGARRRGILRRLKGARRGTSKTHQRPWGTRGPGAGE